MTGRYIGSNERKLSVNSLSLPSVPCILQKAVEKKRYGHILPTLALIKEIVNPNVKGRARYPRLAIAFHWANPGITSSIKNVIRVQSVPELHQLNIGRSSSIKV